MDRNATEKGRVQMSSMDNTPAERFLQALYATTGEAASQNGKGWSARCPAHDDHNPSLSIAAGDDGRVLLRCHAGCTVDAICKSVGLHVSDLMPPKPVKSASKPKRRIVATYDYRDEQGTLLFQVVRYDPKDFRQRRPKPDGGWTWSVTGVRVVPYRLLELVGEPTAVVVIAEGEKDVDNLAGIGVLATCNAGGAGKWTAEHAQYLRGRHVVILADNDEAGRRHAQQVAQSLQGIAASVRIVELPGLPAKGDVSDWIAAGGTKDQLRELADATSNWSPATPGTQPWPKIVSFDELDLPQFPTDVLPGVLRNWVMAESHATQTPPDLAGLLTLAVCSATIARRVVVEPRSGWREPVNLFVAVLLEPGNRKSAVFADAMKPLRELEAELIEATRPAVAREQSDRRQDEARLRKLEKLAAEKDNADARHDAENLAADLAEQTERVLPRLMVDDATAEKLGMMLAEQGGRIASMSPEGGVFDLMAGLYSKSGIPQFGVYLMGHSGDDLITDRVSRKSVRVERPALTCAYAMQPAVIEGLAENASFRGRGLLARFLYATPQSWIGRRQVAPTPVSDATREAYRQAVRKLAEAEGEFVLELAADAAALLRDWEAEIEGMLGDGGQMEIMRDWGAKLAGATLRVAATLHCVVHGPNGQIDLPTIEATIRIGRYLIPHAELVLAMMQAKEDSGDDDARYVLRWIERHNRREFTKRDAQQHGKRRFPKADDIDAALDELVRRGFIRLRPAEAAGPGRPPSPIYEVNPAVFDGHEPEKRYQNSQNPAVGVVTANSENSENTFEPRDPDSSPGGDGWGEV